MSIRPSERKQFILKGGRISYSKKMWVFIVCSFLALGLVVVAKN